MNAHAMRIEPKAEECSAIPIGLSVLVKMAFDGMDLQPLRGKLLERAINDPLDAAALMDLSTIAHIEGRSNEHFVLQTHALEVQRRYRRLPEVVARDGIRLLVFMARGDFMANTPVEFLLENSSITLDMIYVLPGEPLPQSLPEHDVVLVAATEMDENRAVLDQLAALLASWPRPVINAANRIARLTREGTWAILKSSPGVAYPMNARIERSSFTRIASGDLSVESFLDGSAFPIIARPVGSHAGKGLARLESRAEIEDYLHGHSANEFYIAPFVDYRGRDGLFRKYRIALIAGRPFACHMAISQHWMIHYLNAGMLESAEKRAEEERFMADFDHDFAVRHEIAFKSIAERIGLEYVVLDCAETKDGKLLIFEAGNGMIVHSMDPPDLFPYKPSQMKKAYGAFQAMLGKACVAHRPAAAVQASVLV